MREHGISSFNLGTRVRPSHNENGVTNCGITPLEMEMHTKRGELNGNNIILFK
jgi:hypothetical protein